MRRTYPTDLSDVEWRCLEDHLPASHNHGRPRLHSPGSIARGRSSTLSSTSSRAAALGDSCHMTSHPGRPSTTFLEPGEWMEPGKGCTPLYASGGGCVSRETLRPGQGESTAS